MRRAALLILLISTLAVASSTYAVKVIPAPSGFTNVNMVGINNSGQVAGSGFSGTATQAFIGSPQGSVTVPGISDIKILSMGAPKGGIISEVASTMVGIAILMGTEITLSMPAARAYRPSPPHARRRLFTRKSKGVNS
jgi:hypothetical protein